MESMPIPRDALSCELMYAGPKTQALSTSGCDSSLSFVRRMLASLVSLVVSSLEKCGAFSFSPSKFLLRRRRDRQVPAIRKE